MTVAARFYGSLPADRVECRFSLRDSERLKQLFAIAIGGAVGAVLRFWVSTAVYAGLGRGFPFGTLAVNVLGSLIMGLLYVWLIERLALDDIWRMGMLVGVLGAFTTFSTFSIETVNLIEGGQAWKAGLNMIASVASCVLAAWAGVMLGRQL